MKKMKNILAFVLALTIAIISFGCTKKESSTETETVAESGTHTVIDFYGREVELPNDIDSIISITPATTQILAMLGAEDKIVAGAGNFAADTLNGKMFPGLNDLAAMSRDDVNVESVLAYDPDVLIWGYGIDSVPEAIIEAGIPVVSCNIMSPDELMNAVDLMAAVLGGEAVQEAAEYREFYMKKMSEAEERSKNIADEDRPSVYVANNNISNTYGKASIPYTWVTFAGGRLAALDLELGENGIINNVTLEELMNINPDIIFATSKDAANTLLTEAQYAGIKAVEDGKVVINPKGGSVWYLGHVEAPLQIPYAFTVIQPELASDIDIEAEVREFYSSFYEYDLSTEEYQAIMNQ